MHVRVGYDDRSAIIDLISAYTRLYDDAEMDEFSTLFAEDVVVYPNFGNAMPEKVAGKEAVVGFYGAARKQALDAGIRTRHFSTNHLFKSLAPGAAEVVAGMLYAEFAAGKTELKFIGTYCFEVVKLDDGWRIKSVSMRYDL